MNTKSVSKSLSSILIVFVLGCILRISFGLSWQPFINAYGYQGAVPTDCIGSQAYTMYKKINGGEWESSGASNAGLNICADTQYLYLDINSNSPIFFWKTPIRVPWSEVYILFKDARDYTGYTIKFKFKRVSSRQFSAGLSKSVFKKVCAKAQNPTTRAWSKNLAVCKDSKVRRKFVFGVPPVD